MDNNFEYIPGVHSEDEFRAAVIKSLTRLETQMQSLVGNGQPGRITNIEEKLGKQDSVLNRIIGALILVGSGSGLALLTNLFSHAR